MLEAEPSRPVLASILRDPATIRLARVAFVLALVGTTILLLMPSVSVPSTRGGADKVVHCFVFGVLTISGLVARVPTRPLLLGLVAYAALSEVLQSLMALGRSGDVMDALFDVAGIAAGWVVFVLLRYSGRALGV